MRVVVRTRIMIQLLLNSPKWPFGRPARITTSDGARPPVVKLRGNVSRVPRSAQKAASELSANEEPRLSEISARQWRLREGEEPAGDKPVNRDRRLDAEHINGQEACNLLVRSPSASGRASGRQDARATWLVGSA